MRADKSLKPFEIRLYRHYRVVHGVRIALAFVLTFLLVRLLNVPEGTWPLITLVVVMGPISFWGNVVPRAFQRIGGTILGSALGLVALKLELISLPLMVLWCAAAMFLCGWLALGKKPYQALLIGITLSVVVGAPPGDMHTALWRSGDVIFGSLLAMLFTGIWPQRAFIHWRIQMASYVTNFNRLYQAGFSPNLVDRPRLEKHLQQALNDVVKMRGLITPASKETHIQKAIFEAIQTVSPQPRLHAGAADQRLVGNASGSLCDAQCAHPAGDAADDPADAVVHRPRAVRREPSACARQQ
ncbi:inner membrane protein [Klebsiella pneumoniae]|uniref:Inner membrane protein n=1 Tax=Klebsiella pneumoniae TaxID=573 RepID=A0A377XF75_KLEPN|nr:inner membrane protein [Klebsiella pneumoniae]